MKNSKIAIILGSSVFSIIFLTWLFFLNHVSVNEVGVAYNSVNGALVIQSNAGWYVTSPLVKVANLNTLPMTVHVPSMANVINTKIVRLKTDGIPGFIKMQGFSYALGQSLENILMGYAFSGENYEFLEVIQAAGHETVITNK